MPSRSRPVSTLVVNFSVRPSTSVGVVVAVLDQQPVLARLAAPALGVAALHVDEHPLALHAACP